MLALAKKIEQTRKAPAFVELIFQWGRQILNKQKLSIEVNNIKDTESI